MTNWKSRAAAAGMIACALVLSACSSSSDDSSSSEETAAETVEETVEEAPEETVEEAPEETVEEAPEETAEESSEFVLEVVPGSGEGLKIGYISLGDSVPFVKLVSDDIKAQAEIAGAELLFCDSELDGAKALECARTFNTQGADGIINFNLDAAVSPQVCEAGPDVPTVAIDIHQEPCEVTFMGADNLFAGTLAGTELGNYMDENFQCEVDALVSLESVAAGEVNEARAGGAVDGFQSVCNLDEDKVQRVDVGGTIDLGREKFADVLTALTGAERIAVVSLNDDMLLGAFAAAEAVGRGDQIFGAAQGADPSSWDEIQNNPNWIGDTAYFPERYGTIAVPAIIGHIKGQDVPENLFVPHEFIDADNFAEYYG